MAREFQRGRFNISTDKARLNHEVIHRFLETAYWSPGIPKSVVDRAISHSLCFGLYQDSDQIGFARVVTDYTNHAYLCDLFVLEAYRGQGLGRWLVECIVTYPELQNIRRMLLATEDAHNLYREFGFQPLGEPHKFMEKPFDRSWERDKRL